MAEGVSAQGWSSDACDCSRLFGRAEHTYKCTYINSVCPPSLPTGKWLSSSDRAAQLLLDLADASEISRQLELALFYDRQLNLKSPTST